ncbi:MAG: class I SAM-dependent methyltransferase [Candidatus Omnitrophota bacterium]
MIKEEIKKFRVLYLILRPAFRAGRYLKELTRYFLARFFSRPYFGRYMLAGLAWPERQEAMKSLLRKELAASGKEFNILEIGTWAGSSAFIWAGICKEEGKGKIFCVDHWRASPNSPEVMKKAVKNDRIFNLFLHNMRAGGHENVFSLRGPSDELLKVLKPESFDFIYVDGDHGYSQARKDILSAVSLLKDGGIICGDDLDVHPDSVEQEFLQQHKEEDYVQYPSTGEYLHPGVALVIKEIFDEVDCWNGFWAVRKNQSGWEKTGLKTAGAGSLEISGFDFFIDREKGKPCLVAGNAPSIQSFPFNDFKGVSILMNSGPVLLKGKIAPDYWMSANYYYPIPDKDFHEINRYMNTVFIFSDTAVYLKRNSYNHSSIDQKLNIPWFAFDVFHSNGEPCQPRRGCCEVLKQYPDRLSIFEFLKKHYQTRSTMPTPNTAVVFSLAFAVLMGCSPIYVNGVELPQQMKDYRQGGFLGLCGSANPYANGIYNWYLILGAWIKKWFLKKEAPSAFVENIDDTLEAFRYLYDVACFRGQKIYNLSETSLLEKEKVLPYLDPDKVRPNPLNRKG